MKKGEILLFIFFLLHLLWGQVDFNQYFEHRTLRIDYYHVGDQNQSILILDKLIAYDYYSGNPARTIDTLNRGHYLLKVFSLEDNQLIYSRGFSSLFNEWQTTSEAINGGQKVIHETFLIPFPKSPVLVQLWERDKENDFTQLVGQLKVDPESPWIQNNVHPVKVLMQKIMYNGPSEKKVDLVILGDGYTFEQQKKFFHDAKKYVKILFSISPFAENKKKFNVTAILLPSRESGIDMPDSNYWVNNSLHFHFYSFGSPRYVLSEANSIIRDVAGSVPYDFIHILANTSRYGGGGIYQLYAVSSSDNKYSDYVFVHEFGHSFAGLGDEYYTSSVAYTDFYKPGIEPWEPNITAHPDPKYIKWKDFLTPGIPVPTPWHKAKFDSLSKVDRAKAMNILKDDPYYGKVGAMEGAGYAAQGLFRPSVDCIMFSKSLQPGFDPVCQKAIQDVIQFYSK